MSQCVWWKASASRPSSSSSPTHAAKFPFKPPAWYPPEWDSLLEAAQNNQAMEVYRLTKKRGVPPDHANPLGQTALHISALWGHVDCVAILVSKDIGADPNVTNRLSRATPLHMAIQGKKMYEAARLRLIVKVLLQGGADPLVLDLMGKMPVDYITDTTPDANALRRMLQPPLPPTPPIFRALDAGDFSQVMALFHSGSTSPQELACQVDAFNRTTVQVVVDLMVGSVDDPFAPIDPTMQSDLDLLYMLLAAGASPFANKRSKKEWSENELGAISGVQPIIMLLDRIQAVLGHNEKEKKSTPSLSVPPIVHHWLRACQALQERNEAAKTEADTPPLLTNEDVSRYWHNAARRGHLTFLRALYHYLPLLFHVNATNRQGMTALHFAARSGQHHVVSYLLGLPSIAISRTDCHGRTALDAARANGHEAVVSTLESRGGFSGRVCFW